MGGRSLLEERARAFHTYQECMEELGLQPHVLRSLLFVFAEFLDDGESQVEGGSPCLSEWAFERLRVIVGLRNGGLSDDEIRERLRCRDVTPVEPCSELSALAQSDGELAAQFKLLTGQLAKLQEQRREDREKLMLALMRLQQELQQLRFEMVRQQSRKERKKGLWARLWEF